MTRYGTYRWQLWGMMFALAFSGIGVDLTDAAPIPPTSGGVGPTLTILDAAGRDVTTGWLPEPGQTYTLQVAGATVTTLTLQNISAHKGVCTNYGTDVGPDFVLLGNQLISNDCGGKTTVNLNGTYLFVLPPDADGDGLPDAWESSRGNLIPTDDLDLSPSTSATTQPTSDPNCLDNCRKGDGISAFDEYRGFIVSSADRSAGVPFAALPNTTKHIRTEPSQKDIFVHVVNGQCAPAVLGGSFFRYFPANGPDMFEFAYTVFPGSIHLLDFTPGMVNPSKSVLWEDFFEQYALVDPDGAGPLNSGVIFRTAGNLLTSLEADVPTDRLINNNAIFPILDLKTNTTRQKGIRLIECQDTAGTAPLGVSDWGTPNKAGSIYAVRSGNSTIFTDRARRNIATNLANGGLRQIRWSIYNPGTVSWVLQANSLTPGDTAENFLTTRDLQYLLGHELAHDTQLRPTSTNGYHTTTGSGSMMDQTIQVVIDRTNSSTNKINFNIPSVFGSSDQQEIKVKN